MTRRKQARVMKDYYCRLVPGDIIELLYDQQGRYAFRVRLSARAPHAVSCVSHFDPSPLSPRAAH
jgi:hypothetical protein